MSKLLQCYNRGCGQEFDPEKNTDESCQHHPGAPYFHDVYKGWSCCNKKSVDFTEFLSIKGCTKSKHSNVKPPEPEKPKKDESLGGKDKVIEVRAPIREALPRPPVDTPMKKIEPTVAPALREAIDGLQTQDAKASDKAELKEGEIAVGTGCKNSGCSYSYSGSSADFSECQYHPGVAVFHEGMKFWSCCQKRTTDFGEFMAQKGCSYGEHKWFKENSNKKAVECRYDWHQTAANVNVAIYAKLYHYELSTIEVNPIRLKVNLVFPKQENATFNLDLELRGVIDTDKVKATMYGSKVEITLPKAEPGSWAKLDFPQKKLPPAKKSKDNSATAKTNAADSDDDFNLDDVETLSTGFRLTEIASTKPEEK